MGGIHVNRKVWAIVLCVALLFAGGTMVSRYAQQRSTIKWAVFGLRQSAGSALSRAATYVEQGMDGDGLAADRSWSVSIARELMQSSVDSVQTLETTDHNWYSWMQIRFSLQLALQELADWQQDIDGFPRSQEIRELLAAILQALPSVVSSEGGGAVYADNPAGLDEAAAFAAGYAQRIKAARGVGQGD